MSRELSQGLSQGLNTAAISILKDDRYTLNEVAKLLGLSESQIKNISLK